MNMKRKGFTLLEVMLAVGMFAVLGLVCLENYLLNASIAQKIIDDQTCAILAKQKEFEYLQNPDAMAESGDFGAADPDARYQIESTDITLSETVAIDSEITFHFVATRIIVEKRGSRISYPFLIKQGED
ncbi:MAG: prepilin-type N-terminal cleavage/methylation domain-containing protein [Candidatus Omnitrophica bacterium]|nr:prepilin-type N-terminal cleavage/methylation domain-containing protein [Candidatus Omnitrophota bacterium]MCM8829158.1 prepilin-type N-terminal cleavage/methylation domain-containing protein [Candidatus Omnitrophota bacterium]